MLLPPLHAPPRSGTAHPSSPFSAGRLAPPLPDKPQATPPPVSFLQVDPPPPRQATAHPLPALQCAGVILENCTEDELVDVASEAWKVQPLAKLLS